MIYRKCLNETLYKNELKYSRSLCLFISPLKNDHNCRVKDVLILSRRRSLPYKNKSINLLDLKRLKRLCQSRKSCSCEMTKLSHCFFPNR